MRKVRVSSIIVAAAIVVVGWLDVSCSHKVSGNGGRLADQTDSLSYVVGMNIAYNIMKMDSTLRPEAVVNGIADVLNGRGKLTAEDARMFFLDYMNYGVYERVRNYEEQYLTDLASSDRDVVRATSGLTYKVQALGNMNNTISSDRDTVAISYRVSDMAGVEVDASAERNDTVRVVVNKLITGLREGVKLVGEGGKVTLWLPSSLGYGSAGDEKLGIKPNQMLRYEVDVVEVKRRR